MAIPYREILLTAKIMDDIFAQVNMKEPLVEEHERGALQPVLSS